MGLETTGLNSYTGLFTVGLLRALNVLLRISISQSTWGYADSSVSQLLCCWTSFV